MDEYLIELETKEKNKKDFKTPENKENPIPQKDSFCLKKSLSTPSFEFNEEMLMEKLNKMTLRNLEQLAKSGKN